MEGSYKIEVQVEVKLNKEAYGKGFPTNIGDTASGYSFHQVKNIRGELRLDYITSRISENPTLEAVTDRQFEEWKKWDIVAYTAQFVWNYDKKLWTIHEQVNQKD